MSLREKLRVAALAGSFVFVTPSFAQELNVEVPAKTSDSTNSVTLSTIAFFKKACEEELPVSSELKAVGVEICNAVKNNPQGLTSSDIDRMLCDDLNRTEENMALVPSLMPKIHNDMKSVIGRARMILGCPK